MISEDSSVNGSEEDVFIFPASFAQQRLWFLDQLVPEALLYSVPTIFRLTGDLHRSALEQSFNEIVRRHEILRTRFQLLEGELVQVIAPSLKIVLSFVQLNSLEGREAEAIRRVQQEIEQPFDLAQDALLRLLLLQLDETTHILLVNLHHIVFDEWSHGVLLRELAAIYTAQVQNQPIALPELEIQYADFSHWQRHWLQEEVLQVQLCYWRRQLQDLPTLNLPSSLSGVQAASPSHRGAVQFFELSHSLLEDLEGLSQQAGATLFMTLLAAFQLLLGRYSGQEDIVVGSPIANRNRSELEDLIGFFVNSLVFRTSLAGNPTVRELLARVREVALGAYAHQDLPFERLVEDLEPQRDLSRNPLFQVVFALQNSPMAQLELPHLKLKPLTFETQTTRFELELYLWNPDHEAGLRGMVVFNTDRFEADAIARLHQHFRTLLEGMVVCPEARLADLPLLTTAEQQQLIEWNNTNTNYPDGCIHQQFEAQVRRADQAIAVRFGNQQFTYGELNRGSNQLARYLQRQGSGVVGVCMERSPQAIAALLAVLKAGGTYLPLDPSDPVEWLRFMLEDAEVSIVLTQQETAQRLGKCQAKIICVDQVWDAIAQEEETNLPCFGTSESLAYVVYTSGSTGTPKGVAVRHRSVNRLVCQTHYIEIVPGDKIAQASNLAFDAATFEIWGALLNGVQLEGVSREVLLSPLEFAAEIKRQEISVLFLTTALFNQMVREAPQAFSTLRCLLFGGEMADPQSVRSLLRQSAPQQLLHVYGPTENTTFTSCYQVEAEPQGTVPIGRAISNTQIYVLDANLHSVPIGISGEIYVGGAGVAQGYLNRPDLNAACFVPHPFNSDSTDRLYKTGDLGRYCWDGNLEFLGRVDQQIKLRGFRIELGEVEAAIVQHPEIRQAVVMLREVEGDKRLVAYLVLRAAADSVPYNLRSFLQARLPNYMLPAAFVILQALPLNANGKVDRRSLPTLSPVAAPQPTAPQNLIETLVEIWQTLLGLEVSVHDNFFELGGHSLLATQLMSRVRSRLQVELPLRSLFEAPTIAGLAQAIELSRVVGVDVGAVQQGQHREEVEL